MKKVEAIIRPSKLTEVRDALVNIGIVGMTISDVMGLGRQEGYVEIYRGTEYEIQFLNKIKIEVILEDELVEDCIDILMEASRTGKIGDGKIIITTIDRILRIRTGEANDQAI